MKTLALALASTLVAVPASAGVFVNVENNADYTGSDYSYEEGDKAISKPFIGWYMKVGDEWMKIKRQTLSISGMTVNDVVSYATITIQVQRGYFGTELVEHEEGELIQVFDTLPNGFVDDEET